jgi:hypothetical protein
MLRLPLSTIQHSLNMPALQLLDPILQGAALLFALGDFGKGDSDFDFVRSELGLECLKCGLMRCFLLREVGVDVGLEADELVLWYVRMVQGEMEVCFIP